MKIVYALEDAPESFDKSLFLAGPSPRGEDDANWRTEALRLLEELEYDGVVFVPLPRDGGWAEHYEDQVVWETKYLQMADLIVFWVPRDLKTLPAFTTNVEFGLWLASGKVILGYPPEAPKIRFLDWHAKQEGVPTFDNLETTLKAAVERLDWGALRTGGEREVPLHIWNTPSFQDWYKAQTGAGNRLDGAKVVWAFRVGPKKKVFFWALHVDVWIEAEDRHKTNEIVLSRPDISTIVAYRWARQPYHDHPLQGLSDTEVVLIREFRSPAVTPDGYIRELPGGSSWHEKESPEQVAADEFHEETGIVIDPKRFTFVDARQVAGTLSAHFAHVYAVELTREEMDEVKSHVGDVHGVEEDTERTYLEYTTVEKLVAPENVDWAMTGMILTALLQGA